MTCKLRLQTNLFAKLKQPGLWYVLVLLRAHSISLCHNFLPNKAFRFKICSTSFTILLLLLLLFFFFFKGLGFKGCCDPPNIARAVRDVPGLQRSRGHRRRLCHCREPSHKTFGAGDDRLWWWPGEYMYRVSLYSTDRAQPTIYLLSMNIHLLPFPPSSCLYVYIYIYVPLPRVYTSRYHLSHIYME